MLGSNYELVYRAQTTAGSCAPPADEGATQLNVANDLLKYGVHTQTMGNIPSGSCRTGSLFIKHIPSGDIIDIAGVFIDNL